MEWWYTLVTVGGLTYCIKTMWDFFWYCHKTKPRIAKLEKMSKKWARESKAEIARTNAIQKRISIYRKRLNALRQKSIEFQNARDTARAYNKRIKQERYKKRLIHKMALPIGQLEKDKHPSKSLERIWDPTQKKGLSRKQNTSVLAKT